MKAWLRSRWLRRPAVWAWPLWACAALAVAGWGFVQQDHTNTELRHQNQRLTDEIATRERQSCESSMHGRAEAEQLLVTIVNRLSTRRPEQVAPVVSIIHDVYDRLPPPAACTP